MKISVTLSGTRPIMFDRYAGSNSTEVPPEKKAYLSSGDGKTLVMPTINILSFLSSKTNKSAPQLICGKKWNAVADAALSFVQIDELEIPFTRKGKPLTYESGGVHIENHVARMMKGKLIIPNPKSRPVLPLPWELSFTIEVFSNPDLNDDLLKKLFEEGGNNLGLGTFRRVYGKFAVTRWEFIKK